MSVDDPNNEEVKALYQRIAELEAENERLKELYQLAVDDNEDRYKCGMERAAEIAESDTFAPPYGIRLAKAIRAEIGVG